MDIAIYIGINLFSSIAFYINKISLKDDEKILTCFVNEPSYSPSQIKALFINEPKKDLDLPNKNLINMRLCKFVEGWVNCDHSIKSSIDKKTNLIYSLLTKEDISADDYHVKNDSFRISYKLKLKPVINASFNFDIVDLKNNELKCEVKRNFEVNCISALKQIATFKQYGNLNFYDKIENLIGESAQNLLNGCLIPWIYRGVKLQFLDIEYGIKVGSFLTVFGDVAYNFQNDSLKIENPLYYLGKDRSFIISGIQDNLKVKKILNKIFLIGILMSTFLLLKKIYHQWRMGNIQYRFACPKRIFIDKIECLICNKNLINIICQPCQHFCLCFECFTQREFKRCPYCKSSIKSIIKIFI